MTDLKNSQELQSQVIDFLRFPLVICVIFIHNFTSTVQIDGGIIYGESSINLPFMYYCSNFFSKIISSIAVPLFFFMAGFLFFLNVDEFSGQIYKNKLSRRTKSLLIPYLFWNFAVFVFHYAVSFIPRLNHYINFKVDWHDFFSYFWRNSESGMPIAYQFWFIRDLMINVLLTPFIYFFCKKTNIYGILLLGILWYHFERQFDAVGISAVSVFFFTAGAYFGINKRNLLEDFGKLKSISFVLYPIIAVADLLTRQCDFNGYIHKTGIIIGIMFWFNLVSYLFEKQKIRQTKFLSAASFFVFAIHAHLVVSFRKISYMIFLPQSDLVITSLYFSNVILTALAALGIYYVLRLYLPTFTDIITGGR